MKKNLLILCTLFLVSRCIHSKEKTYTSSTITDRCLKAGHDAKTCKKHATQPKEVIFAFKELEKEIITWTKEVFEQVLEKSKKQNQKTFKKSKRKK